MTAIASKEKYFKIILCLLFHSEAKRDLIVILLSLNVRRLHYMVKSCLDETGLTHDSEDSRLSNLQRLVKQRELETGRNVHFDVHTGV